MEIRWSVLAAQDLEHIFNKIRQDNPTAALTVMKTLYEGCASLSEFPQRGRDGRMRGRRELVFPSLPYIAVYQIKEHAIEISRIYHSAQDWP
jgi:toxin ParE1/3/4